MSYERIWRIASQKNSRLILALDYYENPFLAKELRSEFKQGILKRAEGILDSLREYVVGVKIGFPTTLAVDFSGVSELISRFENEYYFIADYKLSDIPKVNSYVASTLKSIGFDGVITHSFQGGLIDAFGELIDSIDIYSVIVMSHGGAKRFERGFRELLEESMEAGIKGFVVGATKPKLISEVRRIARDSTILSPGVVTQGAEPSTALRSGGDFEIVGRAIVYSKNPVKTVFEIVEAERNALSQRIV